MNIKYYIIRDPHDKKVALVEVRSGKLEVFTKGKSDIPSLSLDEAGIPNTPTGYSFQRLSDEFVSKARTKFEARKFLTETALEIWGYPQLAVRR